MHKKILLFSPIILAIAGLAMIAWYLFKPISIRVNDATQVVRTSGLTVDAIIRTAGIKIYAGDEVSPPLSSLFLGNQGIRIRRTSSIAVWIDGQRIAAYSSDIYPANILMNYEVNIFPGDTLTVDGKNISGYEKFIPGNYHTIQYRSAGFNKEIEADSTLQMDTVGINLARERQPLMGLDYAIPNETAEYSQSGARIVRVEDTIVLEQKVLPIEYLTQSDDEVELDLQVITRQGENGLAIDLTRIRRENGKELSRKTIDSTTIRPSVDQILSFGTKAVVKQLEVGGTTIEYWRAVPMYATSYSPCRSGIDGCSYGTAGGSRAGKGIVAVVSRWFPSMRGQQVYIPGYGFAVIGDTGGGIPGTTWIDLGFDDDNYETWHQWVTVYFLTPIPTNILYILN